MRSKVVRQVEPHSSPDKTQCATGLTKVGLPGARVGLRRKIPTIADLLKPLGYVTGQFGKNHLGDRNEFLPTVHGFDEFYGNLYHLNSEEEPEDPDYPEVSRLQGEVRPAWRAAQLCHRQGRSEPSILVGDAWANKRSKTPAR